MTDMDMKRKRALALAVAVAKVKRAMGGGTGQPSTAERVQNALASGGAMSPERKAALDQANRTAEDRMILADEGAVGAGLAKVNQGLPLVGQWFDEGVGRLGGDQARDRVRNVQGAMDRQYPGTSLVLQLAGGVTGGLGMAPLAAPLLSVAPASMAGQVATGIGAGLVAGITEGAVSGAGAANGGDRGAGAVSGALIGGGAGAALGLAAPLAVKGISAVLQNLKGRDYTAISKALGISKDAAKVVARSLKFDDFNAAEAALRRAGKDAMLADAGPGVAGQLDIAMSGSPQAASLARTAIDGRVARMNTRLTAALDSTLGKPEGTKAVGRSIASRTAAQRTAAYDKAFANPIDYASPKGQAIEAVIARVPNRTLSRAIQEANEAMQAGERVNRQIMAEIAPDGKVTFREMPNVEQLNQLKIALQTIAREETDDLTGKITGAGLRAKNLAGDLRQAIEDAAPDYGPAVKLGGDKIAEEQAAELGRKLLSPATTRETVRNTFEGRVPSAEERLAAQRGLRSYIDETLAQVQAAFSDPNTDIREAAKLVKAMSSRANREKVTMVLGKGRADVLYRTLDQASAFFETRALVAGNSRTAARTAGQRAMEEVTAPGAMGELAQGNVLQAGRGVIRAATGTTPEALQAVRDENWTEIAKALTTIRGADAEKALVLVRNAIQGQPMKKADADLIAKALSTGGALAAYQASTQKLTQSRNALAPR